MNKFEFKKKSQKLQVPFVSSILTYMITHSIKLSKAHGSAVRIDATFFELPYSEANGVFIMPGN